MKKSIFLTAATVLFVFVLAACSGADTDEDSTPGAFGNDQGLGTPSTGLGTDLTPEAGLGTSPATTAEVTKPATTPEVTEPMNTPEVGVTETMTSPVGGIKNEMDAGRLSNLLDFEVYSPADDDIGKVEDAILNLETGKIDYIIISVGGLLGIGDKEVAIPCDMFEFPAATVGAGTTGSLEDAELILNVDKDILDQAPDWDASMLPALGQPTTGWDADLNTFWMQYDVNGTGTVVGTPVTPGTGTGVGTPAAPGANLATPGKLQGLILASDALGFNIATGTGDTVGEVKDVVIDTANCDILYLVISYDAAGTPDTVVPVPPAAFTLDVDNEAMLLADADTVLVDAPNYTNDTFPYTLDTGWDDDIRTFWQTHIMPALP